MKIEKIVRCSGDFDEIANLAKVIDKLGLDWQRFSKTDATNNKYWVLEVNCKDVMIEW